MLREKYPNPLLFIYQMGKQTPAAVSPTYSELATTVLQFSLSLFLKQKLGETIIMSVIMTGGVDHEAENYFS